MGDRVDRLVIIFPISALEAAPDEDQEEDPPEPEPAASCPPSTPGNPPAKHQTVHEYFCKLHG